MGPTPFQRHFEHIIAEAPVHDEGEPNEYYSATFMPSLLTSSDLLYNLTYFIITNHTLITLYLITVSVICSFAQHFLCLVTYLILFYIYFIFL